MPIRPGRIALFSGEFNHWLAFFAAVGKSLEDVALVAFFYDNNTDRFLRHAHKTEKRGASSYWKWALATQRSPSLEPNKTRMWKRTTIQHIVGVGEPENFRPTEVKPRVFRPGEKEGQVRLPILRCEIFVRTSIVIFCTKNL